MLASSNVDCAITDHATAAGLKRFISSWTSAVLRKRTSRNVIGYFRNRLCIITLSGQCRYRAGVRWATQRHLYEANF